MNLTLPLNFGERPCDRALLANFRVAPGNLERRNYILWMALLVWRDFGIARDDRRTVPQDAAARATSQTVAIIEQFIGFAGEPGRFVEFAIDAGFFTLVPIDEATADLVLVDFFPANHTTARDISNSKLGGISKSVNIARREAEARSKEQLGLFERTDSEAVRKHGKERFKEALFLVNQICRILERQPPVAAEWKDVLVPKALGVLDTHTAEEREVAFKWFVANRASQELPPRMDFILDRFAEFVTKGRRDFR
jgi:hypothetical protein